MSLAGDQLGLFGAPEDDRVRPAPASEPLRELFGVDFVDNLCAIRQAEHDAYQQVISAWEREHLLLNV